MEAMKMIFSIVERGQGAAMLRLYRKRQVPIHLQCAGKGTATSEIMDILGLGSSEKDVLISFAAASAARKLQRAPGPQRRGRDRRIHPRVGAEQPGGQPGRLPRRKHQGKGGRKSGAYRKQPDSGGVRPGVHR